MTLTRLEQKQNQNALRMARLTKEQRKIDTQIKILIGACVINQCKKDGFMLHMVEKAIRENASDRDKERLAGFADWIKKQTVSEKNSSQ